MKKVIVFLATLCVGLVSVSAMSESELKERLTKSYTVNGSTFQASSTQRNVMDQYLNQYDISSSDADYIANKLDEAFDVLRDSGKSSFYAMSKADKKKVVALVSYVSANTSVDATIIKDDLIIYVPGTKDVFYKTPINPINGEIRQTSTGLTVAAAGLVSMAGVAVALKKAKNND